ncbi:hypothetical protein, partial [Tetragenococcus halophilus]|uniref:hypothetical protein n=1 Tax=Tetragenococcus halophilus TaxID=51669 RepID=UPI001BB35032
INYKTKRVLFVSFVKKVKKAIEFNAGPDLAMDYPIFLCAKLELISGHLFYENCLQTVCMRVVHFFSYWYTRIMR